MNIHNSPFKSMLPRSAGCITGVTENEDEKNNEKRGGTRLGNNASKFQTY